MVQNNEFRQAYEAWLKAALSLLRDKPIPTYEDVEVIFNPDGMGWDATTFIPKPSYGLLALENQNELFNLPEVETILSLINSSTLLSAFFTTVGGNPIEEPTQKRQWLNNLHLNKFLRAYLHSNGTLDFMPGEFERLYDKLERYIYTDEPIDSLWLVQLRNLRMDVDNVPIDQGIYLRKATYEEKKNAVKNQMPRYGGLPDYGGYSSTPDIPNVFLAIHEPITRAQYQQTRPYTLQAATQIAQALELALRLLKATTIGVASYYWTIPDSLFQRTHFTQPTLLPRYPPYIPPYVLTQEDINILPKFWSKAKRAYSNAELLVPITRLEDSYTRTKLEDMLIDFWIGLEALFLPPEFTREMAQTIALAVSHYLGKTVASRNDIYSNVIKSHSLRSRVVHGKPVDEKKLREIVAKTGELFRRSLRKRIEE